MKTTNKRQIHTFNNQKIPHLIKIFSAFFPSWAVYCFLQAHNLKRTVQLIL